MAPDPTPDDGAPDDLAPLDARLGRLRFEPRPSLGPEVVGRARRGEPPRGGGRIPPRATLAAAVVIAGLVGLLAVGYPGRTVTIDRCCSDLDGGGDPDDGVVVVAGRGESVERLVIYEDRDRSGALSLADTIRFERGREPQVQGSFEPGLVALEHCCLDYDGGGRPDDAVLVLGRPPDRIVMAAISDRSRDRDRDRGRDRGRGQSAPRFPLR